jgi:hypothetical protein
LLPIFLISVNGATATETASYFETEIMPGIIQWGSVVLGVIGTVYSLNKWTFGSAKKTVNTLVATQEKDYKHLESIANKVEKNSLDYIKFSLEQVEKVEDLIKLVNNQQETILNLITLVESHETDRINTIKKYEIIANASMIVLGMIAENEQLVRNNVSIEIKKVIEDAKTRANEL